MLASSTAPEVAASIQLSGLSAEGSSLLLMLSLESSVDSNSADLAEGELSDSEDSKRASIDKA